MRHIGQLNIKFLNVRSEREDSEGHPADCRVEMGYPAAGKVMVNVEPSPSVVSTARLPPWAFTIS